MGYVYFGEAAGARILRYGLGVTQVGDPYNLDVQTWPFRPAGDRGICVFRSADVLVRHTLGYNVTVTPIVDGVAQPASSFNGGPPSGSATEETVTLKATIGEDGKGGKRGNSLAVRVQTTSLLGETEIVDVQSSHAVLRATP